MKFTSTLAASLLLPLLTFATPAPDDTDSDLSSPESVSQQLERRVDMFDHNPKIWYEGDKQPVTCNTNSHTCKGKTLTNQICAENCSCDVDSGMISCKDWSGCRAETVEWNCQCHSTDVPPKGTCPGWYDVVQGIQAEKSGKWPVIAPNKVQKHPAKVLAEWQ